MKYQEFLNQIFKQEVILESTGKGLTNQIYRTTVNDISYIVRIPYENDAQIINPLHETQILSIIKKYPLDVKEFYYDPITRIRITYYESEVVDFHEYTEDDALKKVAELLSILHHIPVTIDSKFLPVERLLSYKNQIKNPIYDLSSYQYIIDDIKNMKSFLCICHNDLVSGNILLSKEKQFLIDYEYAGLNDPLFDIMSFITENQIEDEQQRTQFYQYYFKENPNPSIMKQLLAYERFHNLLWLYWAMMMAENRADSIYLEIANDKYQALKKSVLKEV
ncbi:MAG: phosphotransferase [Erysipelotrichaceae bacterium]